MLRKDARKVFATLTNDDDIEKKLICDVICTRTKRPCTKKVAEEGVRCHIHNASHICKGVNKKGNTCGGVAKKDESYCWRHLDQKVHKKEKLTKKTVRKLGPSLFDDTDVEDNSESVIAPKTSKRTKVNEKVAKNFSSDDSQQSLPKMAIQLDPEATDLGHLGKLPVGICFNWMKHPSNEIEYSSSYTINGKCIVRTTDVVARTGLWTLKCLQDGGDTWETSVEEQQILSQLGISPLEGKTANKSETSMEATEPINKSKTKWKKFNNELVYADNFFINGKHVLTKPNKDLIVGLATDEQIRKGVGFDMLDRSDFGELFMLGYFAEDDVEVKRLAGLKPTKLKDNTQRKKHRGT